jgi:Trk K+ transport system NAD-binding subunit
VRVLDYELLLRIQSGFCVSEVEIMPETPVVNRTLRESRPWDHGVIILAIKRNEETLPGIPGPNTTLLPGDVVTVYGQEGAVKRMLQPVAVT